MFDSRRTRLLEAMGYQMLVRLPAADAAGTAAAARRPLPTGTANAATATLAGPAPSDGTAVPPSVGTAPIGRAAEALRATPAIAAAAPAPATGPDRLWQALLAAAAMAPERADANGLRRASSGVAVEYIRDELWVDPAALRASPRDKRGLWKTLRALRRAELSRQA